MRKKKQYLVTYSRFLFKGVSEATDFMKKTKSTPPAPKQENIFEYMEKNNMSQETRDKVQKTIREVFQKCDWLK